MSCRAQSYNDALVFDAKGEIKSLDYRSKSGLPTPLLFFQDNGSLEKVYQQEAINDSTMFKTEMPIADIVRDDIGRLMSIKLKTQVPYSFVLNVSWENNFVKCFEYNLVYYTKYLRTFDDNGVVSDISLYIIFDNSDSWTYGGKIHCFDYMLDEKGNWIKRSAIIYDENGSEGDTYIEERIISYHK